MIPPLVNELKAIVRSHPIPSEEKMDRRLARLERILNFYADKAPDAPENQGKMFNGFVSALAYAMAMIKAYRKLTILLAELAEEGNTDEIRPNSSR
jgi:hypothetical protein